MFEFVFGSEKLGGCEIEISMLCVKCSFGSKLRSCDIFVYLPKVSLLPWGVPAVECLALMKL